MSRRTTLRIILWVLMWLALLLWPLLVCAHSELVAANPASGAQLATAPTEIRLTFNAPLASGSTFVVWGENFQPAAEITPQIDPQRLNQLFATLPPLAAGDYTVQWTTAGEDGHTFSGSYAFRVLAAADGANGASRNWIVAAGAVVLVLLIWIVRRTGRYRWLHESFWR